MVMPPGEQHGVGRGLWSLTAFLVMTVVLRLKMLEYKHIIRLTIWTKQNTNRVCLPVLGVSGARKQLASHGSVLTAEMPANNYITTCKLLTIYYNKFANKLNTKCILNKAEKCIMK